MYLFVIDKLLFLKNYSMNKLFFIIGAIVLYSLCYCNIASIDFNELITSILKS